MSVCSHVAPVDWPVVFFFCFILKSINRILVVISLFHFFPSSILCYFILTEFVSLPISGIFAYLHLVFWRHCIAQAGFKLLCSISSLPVFKSHILPCVFLRSGELCLCRGVYIHHYHTISMVFDRYTISVVYG